VSTRELARGKLFLDRPAEAVARLTIRNAAKRNALDHDILDAIAAVMPQLDDGIETRCVLLAGSEGMFSAGYDIGGIPDEVFAEEAERLVAHPFSRAIEAVEAFPFPTVAVVDGPGQRQGVVRGQADRRLHGAAAEPVDGLVRGAHTLHDRPDRVGNTAVFTFA